MAAWWPYWIFRFLDSCRWHGFCCVMRVYFGMSVSNFMCILSVAMDRNLLIFSDVTFTLAAWWPCFFFKVSGSNLSLALNDKCKNSAVHYWCVWPYCIFFCYWTLILLWLQLPINYLYAWVEDYQF